MGQGDADDTWPRRWATLIGTNLRTLRRSRGISAQALSDQCTELGYPIARSTVANIEAGRKRDLPVQEIAVFAAAIGVAPLQLMYDLADDETQVEILPNKWVAPAAAVQWFNSGGERPDIQLALARREGQLQQQIADLNRQVRQARAELEHETTTTTTTPTEVEKFQPSKERKLFAIEKLEYLESALRNAEAQLAEIRYEINRLGPTPPFPPEPKD